MTEHPTIREIEAAARVLHEAAVFHRWAGPYYTKSYDELAATDSIGKGEFDNLVERMLMAAHIIGEATANEKPDDVTSLMVRLMQNKRAGLVAVEAAAETIAADARFNMWILDEVKPAGYGEGRWMQLMEFCEEIIKRCEAAVRQFLDGGAHEPLINALSAIAADLRSAPTTKPFWPC